MRPDATQHNPAPAYIRGLVEAAGLSQRAAAARIGVSARLMRSYLADPATTITSSPAPYAVQYALERLRGAGVIR